MNRASRIAGAAGMMLTLGCTLRIGELGVHVEETGAEDTDAEDTGANADGGGHSSGSVSASVSTTSTTTVTTVTTSSTTSDGDGTYGDPESVSSTTAVRFDIGDKFDVAVTSGVGDTTGYDGCGPSRESSSDSPRFDVGSGYSPPCDVWQQDCSVGDKCMPVDTDLDGYPDDNQCVPIEANPKDVGEPCTQSHGGRFDDCREGAECMALTQPCGEPSEGTCVALCQGSPSAPECGAGEVCALWNSGTEPWCTDRCDILVQDCPEDWMCSVLSTNGPGCALDESGPSGEKNDPCACDPGCCDPGFLCLDASMLALCNDTSCCTEYCDVIASDCLGAAEGEECVPALELFGFDAGLEDVGVCMLRP